MSLTPFSMLIKMPKLLYIITSDDIIAYFLYGYIYAYKYQTFTLPGLVSVVTSLLQM